MRVDDPLHTAVPALASLGSGPPRPRALHPVGNPMRCKAPAWRALCAAMVPSPAAARRQPSGAAVRPAPSHHTCGCAARPSRSKGHAPITPLQCIFPVCHFNCSADAADIQDVEMPLLNSGEWPEVPAAAVAVTPGGDHQAACSSACKFIVVFFTSAGCAATCLVDFAPAGYPPAPRPPSRTRC